MKLTRSALASSMLFAVAAATHAQMPRDVVIVSPFAMQAGRDAECMSSWDKAAMILRDKPGFKSARLFMASPAANQSSYVTVGVWATIAQFEAAIADPQFKAAYSTGACAGKPAPYRAVRDLSGPSARPQNPVEPHLDASASR